MEKYRGRARRCEEELFWKRAPRVPQIHARGRILCAHRTSDGRRKMSLIDLLLLLLVAGVCGAIGQAIGGFTRGGCLVSIALGFVGALIGMWLARQAGMPELLPVRVGGQTFPVVWAIIGSALFVAVIGFISRSRR